MERMMDGGSGGYTSDASSAGFDTGAADEARPARKATPKKRGAGGRKRARNKASRARGRSKTRGKARGRTRSRAKKSSKKARRR